MLSIGPLGKRKAMIILSGTSQPELAKRIAFILKVKWVRANVQHFEDQELRVQVPGPLYEEDVVIIQSTSRPANDHLIELFLLVDTARRAGARRIIVAIPYFGYGRQDRLSYDHGPISASLIARLLEATGIDRIVTLDLHSRQSEGFFKVGVQNLNPISLFAPIFEEMKNCTVVSPDVGGFIRAQLFSEKLGTSLAVINKTRTDSGNCQMSDVIGDVAGKQCILIDDIVDTAKTLCKAAELVIKKGAKSVSACVTHAVLSGDAVELIEKSLIEKIYVTDSILHADLPHKIQVLSVDKAFSEALSLF
jgi:ribose-phosphate pyrophosphokinase